MKCNVHHNQDRIKMKMNPEIGDLVLEEDYDAACLFFEIDKHYVFDLRNGAYITWIDSCRQVFDKVIR